MTKTPEAKIELSKLIKENGKHGGFDYSVEEADVPKLQLFNDTINNYWIHDRKIFYIKINNKSFVLVQLIVDANNQGNVDILFNILNKNNKKIDQANEDHCGCCVNEFNNNTDNNTDKYLIYYL